MPKSEKEEFDAYAELGVELPSEDAPQEAEAEEEAPAAEETPAEEAEEEAEPEAEEEAEEAEEEEQLDKPEPTAAPTKPRSIYAQYKEKKTELKTQTELREEAEKQRDDALAKLNDKPAAATEGDDEIEAFAKEIGADPEALRKMKKIFTPEMPVAEQPEGLAEFQKWQKDNSAAMETLAFNNEFEAAQPELNQLFPGATAEEQKTLKTELEKLAHTKGFHDKEIGYIAYKNKDNLKSLISPKKRGMESKKRTDKVEAPAYAFNPNADISKMSPEESDKWEAEYVKATQNSEGLSQNSQGRKILL